MNKKIHGFLMLIVIMTCALFSCKKEVSCENCKENNKPPIAIAGRNTIIVLPLDSVILDGSGSSDPDNNISRY